ncbi:MAG: NnrS family protein [Rudaea sp.]
MRESIWSRRVHEPFLAAALLIGLVGFGYAGLLVAILSLGVPSGDWWPILVQAHGHAQLFGFVGLFVVGIGLNFLPKLRATRLQRPDFAIWVLILLGGGILLRTMVQPALAFVAVDSTPGLLLRVMWILSADLALGGLAFLLYLAFLTARLAPPLVSGAPAWPVIPFLLTAFASLTFALLTNLGGTLAAFLEHSKAAPPAWDLLTVHLMLYGFAIPVTFVFSVRNLPLYLRLAAPPRGAFRYVALVYAVGLVLRLVPTLGSVADFQVPASNAIAPVGVLAQAISILVFIILLDVAHRRAPWTVDRMPGRRDDLPPTRPGYPDYGEFGRFELLIYSAFAWLTLAALFQIIRAMTQLLLGGPWITLDAERHALTIGFLTLLIFGMGARMVPGLSGKRRVAFPALVVVTFILGNLAALMRIFPVFFPTSTLALSIYGISGLVGWVAVLAFAINLVATWRLAGPSRI